MTMTGFDLELNEALLAWAVKHCFDIHQNRIIAKRILAQAVDEFRRSAKRNEKKDSVELQRREHRNRVSPEQDALFQRCIYECSIAYEILEEKESREFTQEQLIPRLMEQVVLLGYYNSFHMTVGVCQVLHNYDPKETLRVYECLVQYTRDGKDERDVSRRKSKTMNDLYNRFGDLLVEDRHSKREKWYKPVDRQEKYVALVEEWLNRLIPFVSNTIPEYCVSPVPTSTHHVSIPELLFQGSNPNDEQPFEMRRMHVLLHPPCFSKVTSELGLDDPTERRNIPEFNLCSVEMIEPCS